MPWPGITDFSEAVQNPRLCFKGTELEPGRVSLNPRGMAAHLGLYESAMAGTATLRKVEREIIALVVSLENDCHY